MANEIVNPSSFGASLRAAIQSENNSDISEGLRDLSKSPVRQSSGATLTISASDNNSIIVHTHSSAVSCVLPNNLDISFGCTVIQRGAGKITFTVAGGGTRLSADGLFTTRVPNAIAGITVIENANGSQATYIIVGDLE